MPREFNGANEVPRCFIVANASIFLFTFPRGEPKLLCHESGCRLILTRFVVCHRTMTTRSRFVASNGSGGGGGGDCKRARTLLLARSLTRLSTFLFVGSDAYCKRFQALLSILLTLLPAIPQLQYVSGQSENSRMKSTGGHHE
jgi:hypothetical protein